jgi:hypothetical protein
MDRKEMIDKLQAKGYRVFAELTPEGAAAVLYPAVPEPTS